MADYQGILICGEVVEGKITTVTRQLISIGRKISDDLGQPLSLLLIENDIKELAKEALHLGADRVYTVDGVEFAESHPEIYADIMVHVCQQTAPSVIILGQTDMGRDIANRLAARLGVSVCMDCVELAIAPENGLLLQTKPVYGGNAMAVWASADDQPRVVTIRPGVIAPAEPDSSRQGEIVPLNLNVDDSMIKGKLLDTVREEAKGIKLEEAKVIVAGGGGIGGSEGFQLLQQLAQVLGGSIGASQVACDRGWVPATLKIGQTGHVVTPDLYIAVGISGAMQAMAGCSRSSCIVAINKNPEAHIFKEAKFGVVTDYREFLPPFIEECKKLVSI